MRGQLLGGRILIFARWLQCRKGGQSREEWSIQGAKARPCLRVRMHDHESYGKKKCGAVARREDPPVIS